ncbi:MAG: hypothetical protein ABIT20_26390 [Gemmatimonadaceae bacterium]
MRAYLRYLLSLVALGAPLGIVRGQAGADLFSYQIQFPVPQLTGARALDSLSVRRDIVIAAMACGSELDFAHTFGEGGENASAFLIAKMAWVGAHRPSATFQNVGPTRCTFSRNVVLCDVHAVMVGGDCEYNSAPVAFRGNEWKALRGGDFSALNAALVKLSTGCSTGIVDAATTSPDTNVVRLHFAIDAYCMASQVNLSLAAMQVVEQMGTRGSPCQVFGKSGGDWDMTVRNLTRVAYLDERFVILGAPAKTNLHEQLLTAAGGPAEEHYPIGGCGNTEESTGSSQERADERGWFDRGGFWESLGDFFKFLLKLLIVVAILYFLIWLAVQFAAGVVVAFFSVVLVAGAAALVFPVIPETENHLMMINTSKYLKNQFIIRDVGPGTDAAQPFEGDQQELKAWMLAKMHTVIEGDFIEYNSRPYNRLTISALFNIVDFAADSDLVRGAHMMIDYQFAKFAIGSKDGRRFVPYRRTRESMKKFIDVSATATNGVFDLVGAGDQQIGLGLLYTGQTQQLPGGLVPFGAPMHALYAATSEHYLPDPFVVDLAIDKSEPVFQRIMHHTLEIYSSGPGFLITAGGSETGLAYPLLGETIDLALKPDRQDDLGVALPTTLMLGIAPDPALSPSPQVRTTLAELIRVDGVRPINHPDYPSYNRNECVWVGFACGLNLVVPSLASDFSSQGSIPGAPGPCMSKGPPGSAAEWDFIDTLRCKAYRKAPRVFIAIYRHNCPQTSYHCQGNYGFFEAFDATLYHSFDAFKKKVIADNPPGFISNFHGTYHSYRGQAIEFATPDGENDAASTVVAVDGVTQQAPGTWDRATGSPQVPKGVVTPIHSDGNGLVTIRSNRLGKTLLLDFKDANHPKRVVY